MSFRATVLATAVLLSVLAPAIRPNLGLSAQALIPRSSCQIVADLGTDFWVGSDLGARSRLQRKDVLLSRRHFSGVQVGPPSAADRGRAHRRIEWPPGHRVAS